MVCDGKVLSYVRGTRAGETRLVGRRSIGIGGHINPADDEAPLLEVDFGDAYAAAVQREVAEEVALGATHTDRIVALLNDDTTEVGRVHLGIVHLWTLSRPEVRKREQMITQLAFMSRSELHAVRDTLETWSQFCLDHLDAIAKGASQARV
jgi:predicted NUDIX family phosphoesterase